MKKSCLRIFLLYVVLAAAIAFIVYRRFPIAPPAIFAGLGGGFAAWLGAAYILGIPRKLREAAMIRRALAGETPTDGERNAVIGRIAPNGPALLSPISRTPCVAYKYEIRRPAGKHEAKLYDGFALTPSTIQGPQGMVRLLAYPKLEVSPQYVSIGERELNNVVEYLRAAPFREIDLGNLRKSLDEALEVFNDDDGSVRHDSRMPTQQTLQPEELRRMRFIEWLVEPGQQICAIGYYSAQRGGLIPDPAAPYDQVTIAAGAPQGFGKLGSAVGYLIGGTFLLSAVLAGLLFFHAAFPLSATEQMNEGFTPSWPETRLERLLDRRVRPEMRKRGMLDDGMTTVTLPPGTARGRLRMQGRDAMLSRSEATRENNLTTLRIDGDAIIFTVDERNRPHRLRLGGIDIGKEDLKDGLDLEITENSPVELSGRFTYLTDDANAPACRATFHVRMEE